MRIVRCFARPVVLASVLLFMWSILAVADAQQPESNGAPTAAREKDLRGLIRYGRLLSQCSLLDYASQMYDRADLLSQNIENQDLHLLIASETALYRFKNGGTAGGRALIAGITASLEWAQDPQTASTAHLALAYNAVTVKNWRGYEAELSLAFAEADRAGLAQRQADCFFIKGMCSLTQERYGDAVEAARQALRLYTIAHDYPSQSEAHALLARIYRAQSRDAAADTETRQSFDALDDISKGPILDPNRIYRLATEFQKGHIEAARQSEYQKAANQVLSLLILKKSQDKLEDREADIQELGLRDGELLAYLACYSIRQGDALCGRVFLSFSDLAMNADLSPLSRARHRWLSGMFWRLAGSPAKALELLDKADQMLARLDNSEPLLAESVMEERGLSLLAMDQSEKATASLQQALELSQKSDLPDETARLQRYLKAVSEGKTNVEAMASPPPATATPKARVARPSTSKGDIFDSPFVDETGAASAADAVMKVEMSRLEATPTPVNLSPDFLMRSQLYDQAAIKLEKIIKADGESAERLMQLGVCYFNMHNWLKAQNAFERLLKLEPGNGPAQEYMKGIKRQLSSQPTPAL